MTVAGLPWYRLLAALGLAACLSACAEAPSYPPPAPAMPPPQVLQGSQQQALDQALNDFYGAPYRSGGSTPPGVDCSGRVQATIPRAGVNLPRTVAQQFGAGQPVAPGDLHFGDVLFFNRYCQMAGHSRNPGYVMGSILPSQFPGANRDQEVCHNGIYIGQGRFVHASPRGVFVSRLDAETWRASFVGARRYFAPGQ